VIRGGSWNNEAGNCRAANRNRNTPDNSNNNLGCRLARAPQVEWTLCPTEPTAVPVPPAAARGGQNRNPGRPVLVANANALDGLLAIFGRVRLYWSA